jgi:hypothetical protein
MPIFGSFVADDDAASAFGAETNSDTHISCGRAGSHHPQCICMTAGVKKEWMTCVVGWYTVAIG